MLRPSKANAGFCMARKFCVVERLELVPLGQDREGVRPVGGLRGAAAMRAGGRPGPAEHVSDDLRGGHLGVVDHHLGLFGQQVAAHR